MLCCLFTVVVVFPASVPPFPHRHIVPPSPVSLFVCVCISHQNKTRSRKKERNRKTPRNGYLRHLYYLKNILERTSSHQEQLRGLGRTVDNQQQHFKNIGGRDRIAQMVERGLCTVDILGKSFGVWFKSPLGLGTLRI